MITFDEVKQHPLHYIHHLLEENDPFLMLAYGPYLIMCNAVESNSRIHPILRFMIDVGDILKTASAKTLTFHKVKEQLIRIRKRITSCPYEYSDIILQLIDQMMKTIRDIQYKSNSLESAILNYAPIVPYNGHLTKPGMEYQVRRVIKYSSDEKMKAIETLLKNHIVSILLECEKGIEFIQKPISWLTSTSTSDPVLAYYTLVALNFLTTTLPLEEQDLIVRNIIELSENIQSGNLIDISKAVESFIEMEDSLQ